MHANTKIAPALRKEIYDYWKKERCSLRVLGVRYHVDKRVVGRIIERGRRGDFSIHKSTNIRYLEKSASRKNSSVKSPKKRASQKRQRTKG